MLDNPQGRDCNEMVGYQVRQIINAESSISVKVREVRAIILESDYCSLC